MNFKCSFPSSLWKYCIFSVQEFAYSTAFSLSFWFPTSYFLFILRSIAFLLLVTLGHFSSFFFNFLRNCSSGIGELLWFQNPCFKHLQCLRYPFLILFRMWCHYLVLVKTESCSVLVALGQFSLQHEEKLTLKALGSCIKFS